MFFNVPNPNPGPFGSASMLWISLAILLSLVVPSLLLIPPMWKLCAKAGFPRWFSLAMAIPLANLTLLYFIAFSQWPSELRVRRNVEEDGRYPPTPQPESMSIKISERKADI